MALYITIAYINTVIMACLWLSLLQFKSRMKKVVRTERT